MWIFSQMKNENNKINISFSLKRMNILGEEDEWENGKILKYEKVANSWYRKGCTFSSHVCLIFFSGLNLWVEMVFWNDGDDHDDNNNDDDEI